MREESGHLGSTSQSAGIKFTIRDYRAADFDRLWQIDQLCFPSGIAYTQMELSGFITRRNAVTLVGESQLLAGDAQSNLVMIFPPSLATSSRTPSGENMGESLLSTYFRRRGVSDLRRS